MRLLLIVQGEYGDRMVANITAHAPVEWVIETWRAPAGLPPVVEEPDDFLPESLPPSDLLVSFGEHPGVVELIPDVVERSGARAVIVAVDNEAWAPTGLANQVKRVLEGRGVTSVWPKPLCSLTESTYNFPKRVSYEDALISEFARHFGSPLFEIEATEDGITRVEVVRDATCGCARHVAEHLVGIRPDDAEFEAGMLHHHYPCLATMGIDPQLGDTLMHISGAIMRDEVGRKVRSHKKAKAVFRPDTE